MQSTLFPKVIFKLLKTMDREAAPHHLSEYAQHCRGHGATNTEVCWSGSLAKLLQERGLFVIPEAKYPGTRHRCDIVADLGDGRFWLELKGLWKYWALRQEPSGWRQTCVNNYYSKLFAPKQPRTRKVAFKSHSATSDIEKLSMLKKTDATFVGLLLIGFDGKTPEADMNIEDIPEFKRLAGLGRWHEATASWPDRNCAAKCGRVNSFLWWRKVAR